MSESELKGCGADSPKTYGRDPSSDKSVEADVPARCGEFLVKVPFEFDKNCLGNSVRNDYFAPTAGPVVSTLFYCQYCDLLQRASSRFSNGCSVADLRGAKCQT